MLIFEIFPLTHSLNESFSNLIWGNTVTMHEITNPHEITGYLRWGQIIDIKKVDKQLNVVYATIRYERCSRNPLSGPLLFIYNNMYLSYIY